MSSILGPDPTLQLLEEMRNTVRELTARADKFTADFRTRLAKERLRGKALLEEQVRQAQTLKTGAEAAYQQQQADYATRYTARKVWIGRAFLNSKEKFLHRIDEQVGNQKYLLQKTMLQAEKDREKGLAEAAAVRKDFRAALEAEQQALAETESGAAKSFRGYPSLTRQFTSAYQTANTNGETDENALLVALRSRIASGRDHLRKLRRNPFLALLRYIPAWVIVALTVFAVPFVLRELGRTGFSYRDAALTAAALVVGVLLARWLVRQQVGRTARELSNSLAQARHLHEAAGERSEASYQKRLQEIGAQYTTTTQTAEQELKRAVARAGEMRVSCRMRADERAVRANTHHEALHKTQVARHAARYKTMLRDLDNEVEEGHQRALATNAAADARLEQSYAADFTVLQAEWNQRLQPIYQRLAASSTEINALFPTWNLALTNQWQPPDQFSLAARFGQLNVDVSALSEGLPQDSRLALPGPAHLEVPLALRFPDQGSILIETSHEGNAQAVEALNNIVLRLLSASPPGRLTFTILDPVGLGRNFAGVMHLADYEEQIITNRIWTQTSQIEERLADLNEHMEKVIQMYLRNEYPTITDYNKQAGVIAEKYHFLVIADFPANFSETAARRLLSIAGSGARCGVYMLIHWDRRQPLPDGFFAEELRKNCFCLESQGLQARPRSRKLPGTELLLDAPPSSAQAIEFIHHVGRLSKDSSRVEVPFEQVIPPESEIWRTETTQELRVPIGRTGATKLQYLEIGKGTRQHGLVAGKTGSGKSTLFHVLITNLSLWCSPEQVEFYLVDFKKGVEFKCYATHRLPHARVVAIESDREFGLSVLQRVDDELRRRGDLFRKLGVQDVAGYKRADGKESIPRSLLLIDEFQEFFVEDDKIAQTASLLLDRIVRQGRAFGIHVILGSQTLGGAYSMARTTLGQMVIRIALQSNEADAYLIMDDNNPAPRLLSRPGEAIYNDAAGALEGNSPFQVVWLSDAERDHYLAKVRQHADRFDNAYPGPLVFEGNAPADVRQNPMLEAVFRERPLNPALSPRIWLGAPNSIKGPTEILFQRQSGNNLLVVGQSEEAAQTFLTVGLLTLAAQFPPGTARFIVLDGTAPGTPQRAYFDRVMAQVPQGVITPRHADFTQVIAQLAHDLKERGEATNPDDAPAVFLLIHGIQKYNKLRYEEDFSFSSGDDNTTPAPSAVLNNLITEGPRLGFHVLVTCDTYNNVTRFLSRKALSEFEFRVLFQMSTNDSASLIDNPRASTLGMNRAVLFNEQEGYLETFRPYALPESEWLDEVAQRLAGTPSAAPN